MYPNIKLPKKVIVGKYTKPGKNQKKKDLAGQEGEKLQTKQIYLNVIPVSVYLFY